MRTTLLMGLMSLVVIASAVAQTAGPTVTPLAAPAEPRGTPPPPLTAPKLGAAETPPSAIAPVAPGAAAPPRASTLARTPAPPRIARGSLPASPSFRNPAKPALTGTAGVTKAARATPKGVARHGRQKKTLAKATPKAQRVQAFHAGHSARPGAAKAAAHPPDLVRPRV